MIRSFVKIEFVPVSGPALLLLDYGWISNERPQWAMQQQDHSTGAIGAKWGTGESLGKATFSPQWSCMRLHDTHQQAEAFCMDHPAEMPIGVQGKFRYSIFEGNVYEYKHARILACSVARLNIREDEKEVTMTEYRAACGERVLISSADPDPEIPSPGNPPAVAPAADDIVPGDVPDLIPPSTPPVPPIVTGISLDIGGVVSVLPYVGDYAGRPRFQDGATEVNWNGFFWGIVTPAGDFYATTPALRPWQVTNWHAIPSDTPAVPQPLITPIYS